MSQQDIANYLALRPTQWFDARHLCTMLQITPSTLSQSLRALRKFGIVEFRKVKYTTHGTSYYCYKYKHKMVK